MISPRILGFVGALGLTGCGTTLSNRTLYPEWPDASDILAHDPCSVRREPVIVIRGSEAERAEAQKNDPNFSAIHGDKSDARIQKEAREIAEKSLTLLRKSNPVFLCGMERIEFLGNEAYRSTLSSDDKRPSVAYYDHSDRVLRIRLYGESAPIVHEAGHHIHNLGYFAPTIRDFFAKSWEWKDGTRVHRCEGPHCFLYDKAGSSPAEDWARTFENVLLHPTETVLKTNLNLEVVGRTALQAKIALIFGMTSLEKPVAGTVRVGAAQSLPHSTIQVLAGSGLYLFDEKGKTFSEYALANGSFERTPHQPADASLLFDILKTQEYMDPAHAPFMSVQASDHLFVMGREDNFRPGLDRSVPISLWEIDPAGDHKLGAVAERHYLSKETVLGGLVEWEGEAGYFTFTGNKLSLKTRAPGTKESTERMAWNLSQGLIPLHVMPLGSGKGFGVLAYEKDSPTWNPTATIVRLTRSPDKEGEFDQRRGGSFTIDRDFWKNLRTPVRMGNFLLFPSYLEYGTTLGLLLYDLTQDRFFAPTFVTEALPEEFKKAAGRLESVQIAVSGEQLYLIASVRNGPTLTAPIEFKLPKT